jgi:hypothetical protein
VRLASAVRRSDPALFASGMEHLEELERAVARGSRRFAETGEALAALNRNGLYRLRGYATFADYVVGRWNMSVSQAYRTIGAARVVALLRDAGAGRVPANEAQARELTPLVREPAALREAWLRAVAASEGAVTAAAVRSAAEQHAGERAP